MNLQGATGPVSAPSHASSQAPPLETARRRPRDAMDGGRDEVSPERDEAPVADREHDLLKCAQAGDQSAFGQFVVATQDRLYTLLVRIVGDREEAKELAQESYLRALTGLSKFRGSSAGYTWLYRIAVNLAIARLRKVKRQRTFTVDAGGPVLNRADTGTSDPATSTLNKERAREVMAALGRLDAEYRAVLVMRDVDGLDYKDISGVLGLPLGTVKSRLFRARLALRDELNRYLGVGRGSKETGAIP